MSASETKIEARRRANTELGLLVLALIVCLVAYALVGLARQPRLPAGLAGYGGILAGIALGTHLFTRRVAPGADPLLFPLAFALNGLGLVMIRRIDYALSADEASSLAPAQTVWTMVGVLLLAVTLVVVRDYELLDRYRYMIGVTAIVLLLMPLLPVVGATINGARLWIRIAGFSIQPGEFAKLGLVPPARAFGPLLAVWGLSLSVLVFQRDLGLSLLVFGLFIGMMYVATSRVAYVIGGLGLFALGGYTAYLLFGHVQDRIGIWLDLWNSDALGAGQLQQSLFALGSGGLAGVGLGLRRGIGAAGDHRPSSVLPVVRRPRVPCRPALSQRIRPAAGAGPGDAVRAAGVRHRWRGHALDPADRVDAAVRVLRWLVPARQLHARCAADPRVDR